MYASMGPYVLATEAGVVSHRWIEGYGQLISQPQYKSLCTPGDRILAARRMGVVIFPEGKENNRRK
jgi:hypothetical protein